MKRMIVRLALAATVLTVTSVGLLVLRYHEINEGIRALKQDNGTVAVEHLTPLARFGDRTAQYWLGSIYAFGWGGVAKNEAEATYWFQRYGLFGDPILEMIPTVRLSSTSRLLTPMVKEACTPTLLKAQSG